MIEYNKEERKFTENNGAEISSMEVLTRLRTLEMLQGQIRVGQLLPIHIVSKRYSEKDMDNAYDKGYSDGAQAASNDILG